MILALTFALACTPAEPLEGPGYNETDGLLIDAEELVVAITYADVAAGQKRAFNDHVEAVVEQTEESPGFVARSLRGEIPGREVWTLTVWEDEESLLAFATSGAHLEAMSEYAALTEVAESRTWTIDASEMPVDWDDALLHLEEE